MPIPRIGGIRGAVTVTELPESRRWSGDSVTMYFTLKGTANDLTARRELLQTIPAFYESLALDPNIMLEPLYVNPDKDKGIWKCVVRYGRRPRAEEVQSEIGSVIIQGDTGGGVAHISHSLATTRYPGGTASKDYKGLIGVRSASNEVEGVDIEVAELNFTARKVWPPSNIPSLSLLYALSQHVNSSTFSIRDTEVQRTLTFPAGECRFRTAQFGGRRSDGGYEVLYSFAASPNVTDLSIGGIGNITKPGQHYLWIDEKEEEDNGRLVVVPAAVYVEKVYKTADLNLLRI